MLLSTMRMTLDGANLYKVSSVGHALQRNLVALNGGFFVQSGLEVFGINESLQTMEE